ncbi:hypothetical protein ACH5RR_001248 [Cinchona calisaya]|uniref:Uncharacterized protein n=1 Tax=Cinchona calisaya TaxID=153742 RepID=A0ABD3B424_9GENT
MRATGKGNWWESSQTSSHGSTTHSSDAHLQVIKQHGRTFSKLPERSGSASLVCTNEGDACWLLLVFVITLVGNLFLKWNGKREEDGGLGVGKEKMIVLGMGMENEDQSGLEERERGGRVRGWIIEIGVGLGKEIDSDWWLGKTAGCIVEVVVVSVEKRRW